MARQPSDSAIGGFRWYIEELRVSLFAQELGTSVKVSPERLERLWKTLQHNA
jgi:ATP-dependent helicase HrpA